MPQYEYRCRACSTTFTVTESIARHGQARPKCPACGSRKVEQVFSTFFAQTARKS